MVAIIVLLVLMILISLLLRNSKSEDIYIDSCPDYWTTKAAIKYPIDGCGSSQYGCCPDRVTSKTDADGTNCPVKCFNTRLLGKAGPTCTSVPAEMDFSGEEYSGNAGMCKKREWAKQCGLTWDGITDVSLSC